MQLAKPTPVINEDASMAAAFGAACIIYCGQEGELRNTALPAGILGGWLLRMWHNWVVGAPLLLD